jgi:integrase/recombinase XerD
VCQHGGKYQQAEGNSGEKESDPHQRKVAGSDPLDPRRRRAIIQSAIGHRPTPSVGVCCLRMSSATRQTSRPRRGAALTLKLDRLSYGRWLSTSRDLSPHTVRAYVADVSALERFLGEEYCCSLLRSEDLYRFLEHLALQEVSAVTVRRRISGVRSFCQWLVHVGILDSSPADELKVQFRRARRLPRAVSTPDLRRLFRHLDSEARSAGQLHPFAGPGANVERTTLLAAALMVGTGMRVGELVSTSLSQVDLESRTIRVVGKGLRERMVYLSNDWIVDLIRLSLAGRPSEDIEAPLLVNRTGNSLTTAALRARLSRAAIDAGLSSRLTPHMLRHSAATQLIEAGVDIRFVQRLLGHASLMTTEIYTHVADRSLRHAVTDADVLGGMVVFR